MHVDDTSLRVEGKNHWIHVYSAGTLTVKCLHPKRGCEAIEAIAIHTVHSFSVRRSIVRAPPLELPSDEAVRDAVGLARFTTMGNHQPPPLITVPIDLSDEAAVKLLDFLYEFAHRLESHYSEQLYRYHNGIDERQVGAPHRLFVLNHAEGLLGQAAACRPRPPGAPVAAAERSKRLLLASGQIVMRKADGWESPSLPIDPEALDLAA